MGDAAHAYRAALALIRERPAESEQTDSESPGQLRALRERRIGAGIPVGEVERREVGDGRNKDEFGREERPPDEGAAAGGPVGTVVRLAQRDRGDRGQGEQREDQRELKDTPRASEAVRE